MKQPDPKESNNPFHGIYHTLTKGARNSFLTKISGLLIKIIYTSILTNFLGSSLFGLYALGNSIFRILSKVSVFGMNNALIRFIPMYYGAHKKRELKGVILSVVKMMVPINLILCCAFFFSSRLLAQKVFNEPGLEVVLKYFALSIPFMSLIVLSSSSLQAIKKVYLSVVLREVLEFVFSIILVTGLFLLGLQLKGALLGFFLSVVLASAISVYFFKKNFLGFVEKTIKPNFPTRTLVAFALPVFMVGFSYILLTQTDRLMIGFFLESSAVGIYTVAARIAMLMNMIAASFNTIFVPFISELYSLKEIHRLNMIFKVINKWNYTFSIVILAFFIIFAKNILILFGGDFTQGRISLVVLSTFLLINASTGSNGFILQMTGRQNIEFYNSFCALILNVILNIILIPRFGISGAAVATGISIALVNIIRLIEIFFLLKIQPFNKSFVKPLFSSICAGAISLIYVLVIKAQTLLHLIICFIIFIGSYLVIYFLFGLDADDRYLLSSLGIGKVK